MTDVIALILGALIMGSTLAIRETTSEAIKDAYHGLKMMIQRKLVNSPDAKLLDKYETELKAWEKMFRDTLTKVGADQDEEIIKAAYKLVGQMSKYTTTVLGNVYGSAIGDSQRVEMTFELRENKASEGE